ncbi:xylulose kinase-like isoform X2 [Corticium candelabrum]|uniref:xylulose kinase-like isoform X2 n=1 Tax=Corticium candelabrum TaxID=121492 RepID=UPI002E25820A|nr:xylulose kinase-like isoform X2 [Corticium candelabrum]
MSRSEDNRQLATPLYLGLDYSTQQLKAVLVDDNLHEIYSTSVNFEKDLPEFGTTGGCHKNGDEVTAPTLMWVKATDLLLDQMKADRIDFSKIASISGSGQQHGSIYWKNGSREILANKLNPGLTLYDQLQDSFVINNSPIWMDSSTITECRQLEDALGGPQAVADLTGSRAYERFTGNQICKIFKTAQDDYEKCERISLVSSFGASLFLGDYASIDYSDGSGMNLMDIKARTWAQQALDCCAIGLREKLGDLVPSFQPLGYVSSYYVKRFGFQPKCQIIAFTGDNPASLAGLRLQGGDVSVSLGTSDTVFVWLEEPRPAIEGHVFANPVNPTDYMALLCFKNGSFAREKVRDSCCKGSWETFNESLRSTARGNNGNIGIYFYDTEITPHAIGVHRFNAAGEKVESFDSSVEVRALIEGQFMGKRVHAENLGYNIGPSSRVLATGGAAANKEILQVLSDVFNAPVYTLKTENSASLGAAYQAKHGLLHASMSFKDVVKNAAPYSFAVAPNEDADKVYTSLTHSYKQLEEQVANSQ